MGNARKARYCFGGVTDPACSKNEVEKVIAADATSRHVTHRQDIS